MSVDFLIIGAQKAATSALQTALRQHPDIYMPAGESAFFEDPDFAQKPWETFGVHSSKRLKGIKRPDNLCSDQAIERIASALPKARFIVVLREPVSRAVSSYCYLMRHAHLPLRPLNEGLTACLDAFEAGATDRAASVLRFGMYGAYLEKWYAHYPKDRFLILSQKAVSHDPAAVLTQVGAHLNVDPQPLVAALDRDGMAQSNIGLYDLGMLRVARFGSLVKTIGRLVGGTITKSAEFLAKTRGQKRETLTPELRARLEAVYADDLTRLRGVAPAEVIYWDKTPT